MSPAPGRLSGAVLGAAATAVILGGRAPLPAPDPEPTREAVDELGARLIEETRSFAPDDLPRPLGSAAQRSSVARLRAAFEALGLEAAHQVDFARGPNGNSARVENLVFRSRGALDEPGLGGGRLVFAAHHDSVGASPGASDLAACAALLELAREAAASSHAREWVFLLSDGVEVGLAGSTAFFGRHPWGADAAAVLVLEPCGPSGPPHLLDASAPGPWLARALRAAPDVRATSSYEVLHKGAPRETDLYAAQVAYAAAGGSPPRGLVVGGLGGRPLHHTARDRIGALSARSVGRLARATLDLALALDGAEATPADAHPRALPVFARVGPALVALPARLGRVGGIGLVLLFSLALLRRRRSVGSLNFAAPARLGLSLAGAGAGAALWQAGAVRLAVGAPHHAAPGADLAGALGAALAAVAALQVLLELALDRKVRSETPSVRTSAEGAPFLWIGLGAALSLVAGDAPTPLLPLVACALVPCALPSLAAPAGGRGVSGAGLALLVAGVAWLLFEIEAGLRGRLVSPSPAVRAFGPALLGLPLGLLLVGRTGRARWLRRIALLLGALGVLIAAARLARARPPTLWSNLRYIGAHAVDGATGRIEHSRYGSDLELAATGVEWRDADAPPFPWLSLDRSMRIAGVPAWDRSPPAFAPEGPAAPIDGDHATHVGRLVSRRGADRLHLHLERGDRLLWAEAEGRRLTDFAPAPSYLFYGLSEVRVGLLLEDRDAAAPPWLLDLDWELPPAVEALRARRPADHAPVGDGDVSILGSELRVPR